MQDRPSCGSPSRSNDLVQQPFGFSLEGLQVGLDFRQRSQWLRFIKMPGEGNLVADLSFRGVDPGVRRVGQHLAPEEGLDAALLQ